MTPRARLLALLLLGVGLAFPACVSWESADLEHFLEKGDFPISEEGPPEGAEAVGLIAVSQSGFYLLGLVPVVPISLDRALLKLVAEARRLDGAGISNLEFEVQPASAFKFSTFPIPDWSASLFVRGMAWRRSGAGR